MSGIGRAVSAIGRAVSANGEALISDSSIIDSSIIDAVRSRVRVSVTVASLLAFCLLTAACSTGSDTAATTSTAIPTTLPLSDFAPEECVSRGWAQEPLLADTLAVDQSLPIESLPDVPQVRAMGIVVGCFDRNTLVQAFDAAQSPFDFSTASAECIADILISNQSGAGFIGVGAYTQGTPPTVTEVDLKTDTVAVLTACVPPSAYGYGVVLAPFLNSAQNGAVDVACVDRAYNEQADGPEFWGASFDQEAMGITTEDGNRVLFEPGLYCVSFGTAYAASVKADLGQDLSAATVACMDRQLAIDEAVEVLVTTGSNQELINQAAELCFTVEERSIFGLESGE